MGEHSEDVVAWFSSLRDRSPSKRYDHIRDSGPSALRCNTLDRQVQNEGSAYTTNSQHLHRSWPTWQCIPNDLILLCLILSELIQP